MSLHTAMIFQDGMVLQRHKPIPVWGEAVSGMEIHIKLGEDTVVGTADKSGRWKVVLPAREAGTNLVLSIRGDQDTIIYRHVSVGEVWLAAGQSNMEFHLGFDADAEDVIETEQNPQIHFFDYPEISYEGEEKDYDYREFGIWRKCSKESLPYFSAVGFYFAQKIQKDLEVPIGIIGCNWGGTPACCWIDPSYLQDNEGGIWLEDYAEATKNLDMDRHLEYYKHNPAADRTQVLADEINIRKMKVGFSQEEQISYMKENASAIMKAADILVGPCYERRPGGLYQTMLLKLVPYGIRGVLLYQGESDDIHAEVYRTVFSQLIKNWRDLWKEELPFLFVQLAPFHQWMNLTGERFPEVREAQEWVSKYVPGIWMAASGDSGMYWDIHPKRKRPIGERLALLARGHVYGEQILCDAPEIKEIEREGSNLILTFLHGEGLNLRGMKVNALEVLDKERRNIDITNIELHKNQLILKNCGNAVLVRFAQNDYYEVNLYNEAMIPVKPFQMKVGKENA